VVDVVEGVLDLAERLSPAPADAQLAGGG